MILVLLLAVLVAGAISALGLGRFGPSWSRWITLGALALDFVLVLSLLPRSAGGGGAARWIVEVAYDWIPRFGVEFHLALDGLSLLLVLLTFVLGIAAVVASWTEIETQVPFFHFNLLAILTGVTGVFLATDLILFYLFWELMIVPMYFLIGIWGHENRTYAALKFFIFTQASSLLMLVAILGLAVRHRAYAGELSFGFDDLLATPMSRSTELWLMLGFLAAFVVKLPAIPFHTWLPDAHTEAPTGGSVVLAGLLLKTGAYGLLRFVLPLFPNGSAAIAPIAMIAGVVGILYGAILAFSQTDLKRLVAYTSVSHLGFVLLGVFAQNAIALQGAVMQMLAHGFAIGALFIIAGVLQERLHTRELNLFGGLWSSAPRMGALALVLSMAALGLPGLGTFVGEVLILIGAYRASAILAIVASGGLVLSTLYALRFFQSTFQGPEPSGLEARWRDRWARVDLSFRELALFSAMVLALLWLGLFPGRVLSTADPALQRILSARTATE